MRIITHQIDQARLAARWRARLVTPPVPDPRRRLNRADASRSHAGSKQQVVSSPAAVAVSVVRAQLPMTPQRGPGNAH